VRSTGSLLRWLSIGMILAAAVLILYELVAYSRERTLLPRGTSISGLPVGGLSLEQASQLLVQIFNQPVEARINDAVILIAPSQAGFSLDIDTMLAAADSYRSQIPFWEGFWSFLWNTPTGEYALPLAASYSPSQMRMLLEDIAARYDIPPIPPQPQPGTPFFSAGQAGVVVNQDLSAELIKNALWSTSDRAVVLPVITNQHSLPTLQTLETLIKQIVATNEFQGLVDVYMLNLQTGQELHLVRMNGQDYPEEPDVAFPALSTIKMAIMVETYRTLDGPPDTEYDRLLRDMITLSGNDPSDWLMQKIDRTRGPLVVSQTMKDLGLQNTFIAGYFAPGSIQLANFVTPANSRKDIRTDLDPFNQTTPTDLGMLLEDIYFCEQGGGTLALLFPGQITPEECGAMIDLLSTDRTGILIEGGLPEGTKLAHKHGWDPVIFHTEGDAAIVYTPGGNYILSVFVWQQDQLLHAQASKTISDISRAVYNYFNPPSK
jgi:beta-lactamase class A